MLGAFACIAGVLFFNISIQQKPAQVHLYYNHDHPIARMDLY